MKKTLRFTALVAVMALAFAACDKPDKPNGNGDSQGNNDPKERVIVYTVGQSENRQTLETEGDWDALLDVLCTQAQNGQTVTFYNMSQTTYLQDKGSGGTKAAKTFSTTDRDAMKAWMKEIERTLKENNHKLDIHNGYAEKIGSLQTDVAYIRGKLDGKEVA